MASRRIPTGSRSTNTGYDSEISNELVEGCPEGQFFILNMSNGFTGRGDEIAITKYLGTSDFYIFIYSMALI